MIGNQCTSACNQLHNEYNIASQLDHLHITKPIEIQRQYKGGCMMILPKAECDAFDYFSKGSPYTLSDLKNYLRSMASALCYLHDSCNITHNDVKLENVLCFKTDQQNVQFQLCDFGFAYSLDSMEQGGQQLNKIDAWQSRNSEYFSPAIIDQIQQKQFDKLCEKQGDIFALGYSLFIILFQRKLSLMNDTPYVDQLLYKKILKEGKNCRVFKLKTSLAFVEQEYDLFIDLLLKMLVQEDDQRITASQIINHPFLSQ